MNKQLLKTSGADVISSERKLRKPYGQGGGIQPPALVRPRVDKSHNLFCHKLLNYLLIEFLYVHLKMCMHCSSLCHTRFSLRSWWYCVRD